MAGRWARRGVRAAWAAVAVAAWGGVWAGPAQAITVRDDIAAFVPGASTPAQAARSLAEDFRSITEIVFGGTRLCTGALIAPTRVLTANHCVVGWTAADTVVNFTTPGGANEEVRGVASIAAMGPTSTGTTLLNGSDLAVLTLSAAVTGRDPFLLYDGPVARETALMVGYGENGTGSAGTGGTRDGARWGAFNVIDTYGAAPTATPGTLRAGSSNILATDFDSPAGDRNSLGWATAPTGELALLEVGGTLPAPGPGIAGSDAAPLDLEGTTARGDSGGPLLLRRGLDWVIAGVLSGGSNAESVYGDVSWWTSVLTPEARAFVEDNGGTYWAAATAEAQVPLPAGGALLAAALAAGAALRRRARARA